MSSERRKPFPFDEFEPRWQQLWETEKTYRAPGPGDADFDASKPKFFVLDMFPYPSGAGLHVGHPEGYTATDIIARAKRMQGHNVLHPMGWDAFGLPAEQYAIKTGQHPRVTTEANVDNFRRQLKAIGFSYDWDREVNTTDPGYVRWTQWIFLQLYHSYYCQESQKARPVSELEAQGWTREQIDAVRLAFVHEAPVNWSPDLGTVLANEEVDEWKAKGHTVERRPLRQWMLRITSYAQRLIDELEPLDWPEGIKLLQRNWIGRSEGAEVEFKVVSGQEPEISGQQSEDRGQKTAESSAGDDLKVTVFTTRPDTLFGATYMVLAPEHPFVSKITSGAQKPAVEAYVHACASKSDMDRGDLNKDKSGVFTGAHAINPVNGEKIPVWIADYVMMGYGTGAIMAVPAHDERDFEFAKKFELPIQEVVSPKAAKDRGTGVPPVSFIAYHPEAITQIHERFLPHWQQSSTACSVTWRLNDSLPAEKLKSLQQERSAWLAENPEPHSAGQEAEFHEKFSGKIEPWLDAGAGECILRDPQLREVIINALKHFDGDRYYLYVAAVMPNHVHVLFKPLGENKVCDILQSWKSFTAKEINKIRESSGVVWQPEYFDRMVRSQAHFDTAVRYILENPVKARLSLNEASVVVGKALEGILTGGTPVPLSLAFCEGGFAVNSGFLDGLPTVEAKARMIDWLEEKGIGKRRVQFKLRDWLFSRQRYWGEPFPIIWENGNHAAIPESELPLLQPDLEDFKPTGDPRGPLIKATDWIQYSDTARRETNTMPQWAGSCWYYLRYCDPKNTERFISKEAEAYWLGGSGQPGAVDLYVGGTEHAVLHLLYARFWHKVLFDLGYLSTPEPFQKLVNQGLILGEMEFAAFRDNNNSWVSFPLTEEQDGTFTHKNTRERLTKYLLTPDQVEKAGDNFVLAADSKIRVRAKAEKMSKSLGNVVNPDDVIREYGADSLRLYEMFMGPLEQVKPWSMKGVEGVSRFLARVWRVACEENQAGEWVLSAKVTAEPCTDKALRRLVHQTIKKVTGDIAELSFNTAISQMMVLTNAFTSAAAVPLAEFHQLLLCLNPFAPHLTEELYARLRTAFPQQLDARQLCQQSWPQWDEAALVVDEIEIVIQVNGKLRDKITVPSAATQDEIKETALASAKVQEHTAGGTIAKVIVVPGKLVNIVVKP